MKGLLGVETPDELIFDLILKTNKNGKVTLPTMFNKFNDGIITFMIPLYEENDNLCFPRNLAEPWEEEHEYADFGFIGIFGAENVFKLFNGEEVPVTNFIGKLSSKKVVEELIKQKRFSIKCNGTV